MHAHIHLRAMQTERKRMRVLLFRKIPMRSQSSMWGPEWLQGPDFSLYRHKPKSWLTSQKNSAAQPLNNGVQPHSSDTAGSGDGTRGGWKLPPFIVHPSEPPLTRQVVPEGRQSPSPCVLPAQERICGNISIPSMFPLHRGRMLHAELHCVSPSSQTQGLLGNLCIIKHESVISVSPEALLVYWPSAICSYTLAK